ncbi:MAG: biotin/lipoyl-containing protein, partial [Planctomycetota bacterium]
MQTFLMPTLGADMEAGTLVAWHKQPGDAVRRGDTIAAVDTEKGVIDVEVFYDGILDTILVPPGKRVPVGTPLAMLRTADEGELAMVPAETGEERPPSIVLPARSSLTGQPVPRPFPVPAARPALQPPLYAPGLDELGRLRISP